MTDESIQDRSINVPCICPPDGQVHPDGDTVTLRETLDFQAVRAVRYAAQIEQDDDEGTEVSIPSLLAVMSEGYIMHGVESWTARDGKSPLEVNKANVRKHLLGNMVAAQLVGDLADVLYRPQVFLPLAELARRSSQPSPTNESTSVPTEPSSTSQTPTDGSAPKSSTRSATPRRRSRPSSTTSTQTVSIAATSRASDGAYTS